MREIVRKKKKNGRKEETFNGLKIHSRTEDRGTCID
jgi:hypothetical protein